MNRDPISALFDSIAPQVPTSPEMDALRDFRWIAQRYVGSDSERFLNALNVIRDIAIENIGRVPGTTTDVREAFSAVADLMGDVERKPEPYRDERLLGED